MSDHTSALERHKVLGIRECTRCGKTGDPGEEYGVRGIGRIQGNLCVECVRELESKTAEVSYSE